MKSMKKILFMFLAAMAFVACDDDVTREPSPEVSPDCQQVYFDASNDTKLVLTPDQVAAGYTVDVLVKRNFAYAAASIPVIATVSAEGIFDIPETIEFADGDLETTLQIAISPETPDGSYSMSLLFEGDEYLDPYTKFDGGVTYSLSFELEAWEYLGMAQIRDDIVTTFFSVSNVVWECECWTRSTMPGFICLKNAYTSTYPYNEPGNYQEEDHWFYVKIDNPNKVALSANAVEPTGSFWAPQYMGFNRGYGEFVFATLKGQEGTLVDGVITFPAKGLLIAMLEYNDAGLYYANGSGLFAIAMPGYNIPQPEEPEEPDTPEVDPDAPEAALDAYLGLFSSVFGPNYADRYPDYSTLAAVIAGLDIVSCDYSFITGLNLGSEKESGETAQAALDYVCTALNMSEADLFYALDADDIADINSEDQLGIFFSELPASTYCTLFLKAIDKDGGFKLLAVCAATAATPSAAAMAPAAGSYVLKNEMKSLDGVKIVKMIR